MSQYSQSSVFVRCRDTSSTRCFMFSSSSRTMNIVLFASNQVKWIEQYSINFPSLKFNLHASCIAVKSSSTVCKVSRYTGRYPNRNPYSRTRSRARTGTTGARLLERDALLLLGGVVKPDATDGVLTLNFLFKLGKEASSSGELCSMVRLNGLCPFLNAE